MKMDEGARHVYKTGMCAKNWTVIILAGGQSRRMGRDKASIILRGTRLIDHVAGRVSGLCGQVLISGPEDYGTGLQVIPDNEAGPKGPAAGLYAACQAGVSGHGFFTVPVDAPLLPLDLCERLHGKINAIAATPDSTHQAFAWWITADLISAFETVDKDSSISLKHMARLCGAREVMWPDATGFVNLNTPEDIEAFEAAYPE